MTRRIYSVAAIRWKFTSYSVEDKKEKKSLRGGISETSSESFSLLGIPATFPSKFSRSFLLMVRGLNLDGGDANCGWGPTI